MKELKDKFLSLVLASLSQVLCSKLHSAVVHFAMAAKVSAERISMPVSSSGSYFLLHNVGFCMLVILLVLALASTSSASNNLEVRKDVIYMVNASANAVRRQGIDSSLGRYSFMALSHAKTGIVYNVTLTPYLNGITAQAIRLRLGEMKRTGLVFNEFMIPAGVVVNQVSGSSIMVLVYRKISNFTIYSLPQGYDFVGPVVGIVPYAPSNSTNQYAMLTEDNLNFPTPMLIRIPISGPISHEAPLCAFFDADGSVTLRNLTSFPNICESVNLGDVSLVVPSSQASTQTATHPSLSTPVIKWPPIRKKISNSWRVAVGATFGAIVGLILLSAFAISFGVVQRIRIVLMERFGDNRETLPMTFIGLSRAPTAVGLRTRPTIETEKFSVGNSSKC